METRKTRPLHGKQKGGRKRLLFTITTLLMVALMMVTIIPLAALAEDTCTCAAECSGEACACEACLTLLADGEEAHAAGCSCRAEEPAEPPAGEPPVPPAPPAEEPAEEPPAACSCASGCTGAENCACAYCGESGANHAAEGVACACGLPVESPTESPEEVSEENPEEKNEPEDITCTHGNAPEDCEECSEETEDEPFAGQGIELFAAPRPLAIFENTDLSNDASGVRYTNYDLGGNTRKLQVNAQFTANIPGQLSVTERTLTITIKPGLMFETLPGFEWKNGDWAFDHALLPTELQEAVVTASFVQDTLAAANATKGIRSGTVTYVVSDDNVTAILLEPTVRFNPTFYASGEEERLFADAIEVTTTEKRNGEAKTVETQKLEKLYITGKAGVNAYLLYGNQFYVKRNENLTINFFLLGYLPDGPGGTAHWDEYYINEASFTLNIPKGLSVDASAPISWQPDDSIFENPGIMTWTVQKNDGPGEDGSTDLTITVKDLFLGTGDTFEDNEHKRFALHLTADADAEIFPKETTTARVIKPQNFSVTAYNSTVSGEAGGGNNRSVYIRGGDDAVVTIDWWNDTTDYNTVGYVPHTQMEDDTTTILGVYNLRNRNSTETGTQTIRVDFVDNGACVRVMRLPVGAESNVPNIKLTTNLNTYTLTNYAENYQRQSDGSSDHVVLDLADVSGTIPSEYIKSIEYEIYRLPSGYYASIGATNQVGFQRASMHGYFSGSNPGSVKYTISAIADSISNINGNWSNPTFKKEFTMQVKDDSYITFMVDGLANGQTFMAGESYTVTPKVRITGFHMRLDSTLPPVTYAKGFYVYLRTLNELEIDLNNIYLLQHRGPTQLSKVAVDVSDILPLYDSKGQRVYRLKLSDAYLNSRGTSTNHAHELGYLDDTTFSVEYQFAVSNNATTAAYGQQELLYVEPIPGTSQPRVHEMNNVGTADPYNNENTYNVSEDGNTARLMGTFPNTHNFTIQAQKTFYAMTAARLEVNGSDTGWVNAASEADAMLLTPFGELSYKFSATNSSGSPVSNYVVHIPLPREGQGTASGFPGKTLSNLATFEWSMALDGEVQLPAGVNATVSYSTDYVNTTTDAATFKPWGQIANKDDIKTVRIEYNTTMPHNVTHDYILPLKVLGSDSEKLTWTSTGAVNFYSSVMSYTIQSIAETDKTSQPIAARLSSGVLVGRVYLDKDRNGNFSTGDAGLANVEIGASFVSGPSYTAGRRTLPSVYTNSDGYYIFVIADGDKVELTINNPKYSDKMLRFYGDSVAEATLVKTATANATTNTLQAGSVGMVAPYTVRFDDNLPSGGSGKAFDVSYRYADERFLGTHEVSAGLSAAPAASEVFGYTFQRWYSAKSNSGGITPDQYKGSTGRDITFYAIRTPKQAQVIYYTNTPGNTNPTATSQEFEIDTFTFGETMTATTRYPTAPSGYTARTGKWYTTADPAQQNESTRWDFGKKYEINSTDTIRLFAAYDPYVVVTFNANGGTLGSGGTVAASQMSAQGKVTAADATPHTPTRPNATFVGWSVNAASTNKADAYNFASPYALTGSNVTFYAIWEVNYTIQYLDRDTNETLRAPVAAHGAVGTVVANGQHPAIAGYRTDGTDKAPLTLSLSNAGTTVTYWYVRQFTVTFNPNGGALPGNTPQSFVVDRNTVLTTGTTEVAQRTPPTKGSEIFEYWINSNGGARVDFGSGFRVEQDTEFVAVWMGYVTYNVHHYLAGTTTSVMPSWTGSGPVGATVSSTAHTTLAGYTVAGATTRQIVLAADSGANNMVFYYRLRSYTVTFRDHDGTQLGAVQTVNYGDGATAPALPNHDDYRFVRWDRDFSNVRSNLVITAVCEAIDETPAKDEREEEETPVVPSPGGGTNDTGGGSGSGGERTIEERLKAQEGKSFVQSLLDGDIPLGNLSVGNAWSLLNLILSLLTLCSAVVLLIEFLMPRREKSPYEEEYDDDGEMRDGSKRRRKRPFAPAFVLSILLGVVPTLLFLILEDIRNPMIWINRYTLIFAAVAILFALALVWQGLTRRKKDEADEADGELGEALQY